MSTCRLVFILLLLLFFGRKIQRERNGELETSDQA